MNIGTVGAQYFEQYRYGVENLSLSREGGSASSRPSSSQPSFESYLDQARQEPAAPAPEKTRPGKPVIDRTSKLFEQCQELETFLVKNLLTGMRNTIQKGGLIEEGLAGKFYEDMLWDEYAKDYTRNAGFGLAEQAYLELTGQRSGLLRRPAGG